MNLRKALVSAALLVGLMGASSCSVVGDSTERCEQEDGPKTLQMAGMHTGDLIVVESCVSTSAGVDRGESRAVVASGSRDVVMAALESGGVDLTRAKTSPNEALGGLASFNEVLVTPPGRAWQRGERMTYRDTLGAQDLRYRYVAWGEQAGGEGRYLIMVQLGTGFA